MEVGQYKIAAIIQARLGSSRLPNKVLMPLPINSKQSILSRIVTSIRAVNLVSTIHVATSVDSKNNLIENECKKLSVKCYRGSEDDVLSRFFEIVNNNDYDFVLRFTADNPIIDVNLLSDFINNHTQKKLDYSCSQGLPLGCNFEMIKASSIIDAFNKTSALFDKEHVTPFIKRNALNQEIFKYPKIEKVSHFRFTIDYPSDYAFINLMYNMLGEKPTYSLNDFLNLIENNPWVSNINNQNQQKHKTESLAEEIELILPTVKALELNRLNLFLKKGE
ncbi:cytidylyltransferase domain-containing protein [Algibacter sp. PT7-4]|uniref:cytidylyltransferase domain-containing protein n=1 Tax=Algibacter ulvanivorans TaxID=3400999 RepID=UPI003AADE11B